MAVETILASPLGQTVLVFLLIFSVVFAVLQKSKILGDGKKQVDALVALSVGLITISVGYSLDLITKLIPFLAISLTIILVFLLLIGFFYNKEFEAPGWMKTTAIILAFLAVLVAVIYYTGAGSTIYDFIIGNDSTLLTNIIIVAVAVIAIAIALGFGGKTSSDK